MSSQCCGSKDLILHRSFDCGGLAKAIIALHVSLSMTIESKCIISRMDAWENNSFLTRVGFLLILSLISHETSILPQGISRTVENTRKHNAEAGHVPRARTEKLIKRSTSSQPLTDEVRACLPSSHALLPCVESHSAAHCRAKKASLQLTVSRTCQAEVGTVIPGRVFQQSCPEDYGSLCVHQAAKVAIVVFRRQRHTPGQLNDRKNGRGSPY